MSKNEKAAMIDKLMADLNSSKVDDEEAARIKQLVEAIKQLDESASTSSVESQPESPNQNKPAANSPEPNTSS
jgi:hypothetical protein